MSGAKSHSTSSRIPVVCGLHTHSFDFISKYFTLPSYTVEYQCFVYKINTMTTQHEFDV